MSNSTMQSVTHTVCVFAPAPLVPQKQLLAEMESKAADASCKSHFVLSLLDDLAAKGHRTLVFSQSRIMLDILQVCVCVSVCVCVCMSVRVCVCVV
jgi:SNF2 family DNA or RNA helicase